MADKLFKLFFGLFIVSIPWQTRWIFIDWKLNDQIWEYGRLGLYGSMILLVLAVIFFLWRSKKALSFFKSKLLWLALVYFIVVSIFSPIPIISFYYVGIAFLVLLFVVLLRSSSKIFVAKAFLLSGLIQGLFAIQQIFSQKIAANKWLGLAEKLPENLGVSVVEFADQRILRAYGSLPHPNILGGFLLVAIFAGLYLWINFYRKAEEKHYSSSFIKKNSLEFLFILFSLTISSFALIASFSRSALLALVCAMASVVIINALRRKWLAVNVGVRYVVFLIILFTTFNFMFPGAWTARYQAEGRLEKISIEQREESLKQFDFSNPRYLLIGQGLGMNTFITQQNNPEKAIYESQPIHNTFFLIFAEVGIIGVVLLLLVLIRIFKTSYEADILSTSLLLALIIIGLFDHYLWTTWTGWLLLSFVLANLYRRRNLLD